jgi:quinol monooxygenase YgiN
MAPRPVDAYTPRIGRPCQRPPTTEMLMIKLALFVRLEAKPGKEAAVAKFLEAGLALANQEATTPIWFALKLSPTTFGVFDAFHDESGRQAHLAGPIAQALMAKAPELFAAPPVIERIDVLGLKNALKATV